MHENSDPLRHRYPDAHECSGPISPRSGDAEPGSKAFQVDAAKALLAKNFLEATTAKNASTLSSSSVSTSKAKTPKDPAKLAKFKAVELIKMRHKAVPGDPKDKSISVALDRRVHLFVRNEVAGNESQPTLLWFRKARALSSKMAFHNTRFTVSIPHNRISLVVGSLICSMCASVQQKR